MRIDLHTHSSFSDGTLTVPQLVSRAAKRGIKLLALTDHDSWAGIKLFQKCCFQKKIIALPGVELSTNHRGRDLHLVLYNPQERLPLLLKLLKKQQGKRVARARGVLRRFSSVGFYFSPAAKKRLFTQHNVGKPHLAAALVATAANRRLLRQRFYVPLDIHKIISQLLDQPGQFGYIPKIKITTLSALKLAKQLNAKVSLAHLDLDLPEHNLLEKTLRQFRAAGLFGLELPHSITTERPYFRRLAKKLGLTITYGLDFHDANRRGLDKMGITVSKSEAEQLIKRLF